MTTRPWMKFYPSNWRADPRLRMCSLSARGLWIDLISYMHEGEPYGHLTINGIAPDMAGIASLVSTPKADVRKALAELEAKQVFSKTESGVIYSRRMVRDSDKAEEGRKQVSKRWNGQRPNRSVGGSPTDPPITLDARDQSSEPNGSGADAPPDPKTELFRRGREILGKESGGLIAKLLKSFGKEDDAKAIAKARARLEDASTKANPAEWIGRVLAPKPGEFKLMSNIEGVI